MRNGRGGEKSRRRGRIYGEREGTEIWKEGEMGRGRIYGRREGEGTGIWKEKRGGVGVGYTE